MKINSRARIGVMFGSLGCIYPIMTHFSYNPFVVKKIHYMEAKI